MSRFTPHYRITVQRESTPDWEGEVRKVAAPRTAAGDEQALRTAIEMASALTVGGEGRCEFGGYTVYVSYCERFGESELLSAVERSYSWDSSSDYTYASNHCGHLDSDMHSRVTTELAA